MQKSEFVEIVKFSDGFHKNRGLGVGDRGWAIKIVTGWGLRVAGNGL